jgi:light-regulated signal transduction histidine kinase (bacteriophytochrome)
MVLDTVQEPMLLFHQIDGDLLCVATNDAWSRLSGRTASESVGSTVESLLPARARERVRAIADGAAGVVETYDELIGDVELHVSVSSVVDGGTHVLWFAHDVTELRSRERQAAQVRQELERSNGDLEAFAAVASHDLQEPLRMVSSYVELLARRCDDQLDERAQTYLAFALDGANRMRALVDALLDYAQVRTSPPRVHDVDLCLIVAKAVHDLGTAITDEGAVVTVGPLPIVRGSASDLGRLVQNLLSNALKFRAEEAPRIDITVERAPGEWCLLVDDNGIGIPDEARERVFTMFTRLHGGPTPGGNGMGLALCRGIAERHGGRMWIERSPSGGTRVGAAFPGIPKEPT